jgi:hypothetical protein
MDQFPIAWQQQLSIAAILILQVVLLTSFLLGVDLYRLHIQLFVSSRRICLLCCVIPPCCGDQMRCWRFVALRVVCTVSLREGGFGSFVRLFGCSVGSIDSVFLAD